MKIAIAASRRAVAAGLAAALLLVASQPLPQARGNTVVDINTNLGTIEVELFDNATPITVANFLSYLNAGTYTDSIIHRSAPIESTNANDIIQGGGFNTSFNSITPSDAQGITNEYNVPNVAGTIAMARTSDVNSATTQWFFNVNNNPALNDVADSNQYAVFGRVLSGMSIVDAIAALPTYDVSSLSSMSSNPYAGAFTQLPLQNYSNSALSSNETPTASSNLIVVNSITDAGTYQPPWQNPTNRFDVLNLGVPIPRDALVVIQYLNVNGSTTALPAAYTAGSPYYDVAGDGYVTDLDATQLITNLNAAALSVGTSLSMFSSDSGSFGSSSMLFAVPEPSSAALAGLGFASLAICLLVRRRRGRVASDTAASGADAAAALSPSAAAC